jgi:polysaccharide deacetylase family protein (PEP-CTERM system associated)
MSVLDLPVENVAKPEGGQTGRTTSHARIILSFDVEEHHRIEAARGISLPPGLQDVYKQRLEPSVRWILERLATHGIKATFFIVGQTAADNPALVRAIHEAGHEVASHGWDHRRLHELTPASFQEDVRRSKDTLEQLTGAPVCGYRAPTFSLVRDTAWAIDVLCELGLLYDSSIYPVRHDRYGVPHAPRAPFLARRAGATILEIPPATLRVGRVNVPIGGGGYFRLLPLAFLERSLRQARHECRPPVSMLYFHPWEFDPQQPRLPLAWHKRLRTYVGIRKSQPRLDNLLGRHRFERAVDVAAALNTVRSRLPEYPLDRAAAGLADPARRYETSPPH